MGIVNIVKNIKQIHVKDVVLVHIGKFYYAYGRDAYVLSYLFQYKLMPIEEQNTYSCAFPSQSFSKVAAHLENKKINYIVVDKRNNYDIEEGVDNKNLNTYDKNFEKAKKYVNLRMRVNNISNYLLKHIYEDDVIDKIKEMEKIINETGKV